jgi:cytochrome c biogenesis factor
MIYGVVCFATLFSLVATILGGIWADQSWGRFWGWDPKENGALLIVLWNAIILHARWGGLARERGLALMTVFGNVVTSFSWFGVNMLGVGLHSYGFMDRAFGPLIGFIVSQLAIIGVRPDSAEILARNPSPADPDASSITGYSLRADRCSLTGKLRPHTG